MYGKIYEQTFTGSMFGKGPTVFAVWSYVIANTKPDSLVELNPAMLAASLGTTGNDVQTAIDFLCSDDPSSRSKEFKGRRLIPKGPFIYYVPQAQKYRGLPNDAARRQYFSEKQREHRQRVRECQTDSLNPSKNVKQAVSSTQNQKQQAEEKNTGANGARPLVVESNGERDTQNRIGAIFRRRKSWSDKELKVFKKLLPIDDDELRMIERRYESERKHKDNFLRRDLMTFLNNYHGEADRALSWCEKNPLPGARKIRPTHEEEIPREYTEQELEANRAKVRELSAKLRDELKK